MKYDYPFIVANNPHDVYRTSPLSPAHGTNRTSRSSNRLEASHCVGRYALLGAGEAEFFLCRRIYR